MERHGKNPLREVQLLHNYFVLLRKVKPDLVLAFTVKCNIYGGIACRELKIPFIPNITGIGKGLAEKGLTQKITIILYRLALKNAFCVFFQNTSDQQFFQSKHIPMRNNKLLPGSGVNLKKFHTIDYPNNETIRFLYFARVMKAKGIEQYLEAAKRTKLVDNKVEFHICGYCEEDYVDQIEKMQNNKIIIYHGLVKNVLDYIKMCDCVVLPSFHPEGISNVLLEAAACARPIITTNRVGCKETVDDGVTGFLIKERDSEDLIEKIQSFILLPREKRMQMGLSGRYKIEKEFDRQIVIEKYMEEIKSLIN